MATLTQEQISRAAKIAGGNYIEPSTRDALNNAGIGSDPKYAASIAASIKADYQVFQNDKEAEAQAEQQRQAQVEQLRQVQAEQQRQAQVQPQVQAATTSPSNQSVLTLNNPDGLAVTGQPTAQVQPKNTTLYKDGRTVSVDDANLKSYLANGWSTDSSPPVVDPNRRTDYSTGADNPDVLARIAKQAAEAQAAIDAQNKPVAAPDIPPPVATPATPNTQSLFTEGNTTLGKTLADGNTTVGNTLDAGNTKIQGTINTGNLDIGKTLDTGNTTLGKTLADGNTTVGNTLNNWGDAYSTKMDTTLQNFGTQATNGFMGAFKNFAIPTSQQNGVNLGNYNDNRNAAADQWWSSYVTGRR